MKTSRPSDRLIVIRYIGRPDYIETLYSIIKLYIENPDRGISNNNSSSDRQGG